MQTTILVVDDSAIMRNLVRQTLLGGGYEVILASDGAQGLEAWKAAGGTVNLVITDINMPVMDGEEFLGVVRGDEELRALKVIVVSTESSDTRLARLREHDVEIVHKPFTPEQLRSVVLQVTGLDAHALASDAVAVPGGDFDF